MDAEVEKPKMADVLKAVRGTMLDEMESFIDELGMGDAEVCIIEAIPIPTTGNEDDDRDRLNELVAPFFITIAKALNKVVFPAFEAAFEAASKALLEDIERARGGMSVQNAVIKSAEIEIEDSGLLTAGLMKLSASSHGLNYPARRSG